MSSSYGHNFRITIFGQSHSPAIGVTAEGIPAGEKIDMEQLSRFLARRAPGQNAFSTSRKEADLPEFLGGLKNDITCGAPLTAIIRNTNTKSSDYDAFAATPRPGHADYTAAVKYHGAQDGAGGGHFSGRLTAPLCIAGGICLQLLEKNGISIHARIKSIADVCDESEFTGPVAEKAFPVSDDLAGEKMQQRILAAKEAGDSVGGIVECVITGVPVGLGDPMFDGIENRIAQIVFGIPAVKGLEFGAGFAVTRLNGSTSNDSFCVKDGTVKTVTNNAGGILGGITNGMPVVFRAAFKPTPSIYKKQQTVNLQTMTDSDMVIEGRHDPCVVLRAVPVVEAAAAIAIYDAFLEEKKNTRSL